MTAETKRVLIVASFAPSLINFRGVLIEQMIARGHRVFAAAPRMDDETARKLKVLGAEPLPLSLSNASLDPFRARKSYEELRQLISKTKANVLIAYTIKPATLGVLAAHAEGVPRIVALITGLGYAFTPGRELKRLVSKVGGWMLYRVALSRAHIVLFQNPDDLALFRKLRLLPQRQETAILNGSGVDLHYFVPAALPAKISFLMIARLLGDKGVREFGAAAAMLKASHPDVRVALAGYLDPSPDSISQGELDRIIASGVEFLGKLEDVRPALSDCSVYVLPSYREGTPRSVLEAMAAGRGIITSDAPGCRETVVHGVNGFLVPVRDSVALYRAMLWFVTEPARAIEMGRASRALAKSRYDVNNVNRALMHHAAL